MFSRIASFFTRWQARRRDKKVAEFIAHWHPYIGNHDRFHKKYVLTVDEVSAVCRKYLFETVAMRSTQGIYDDGIMMGFLHHQPNIKPEHIDMLLDSGTFCSKLVVFESAVRLTEKQIEFGLNCDSGLIQELAAKHQNCTEAQRVRYYLRGGI